MGSRDFYIIFCGVVGVICSILTLIAGCSKGTLHSVAIITYYYDINWNSSSVYLTDILENVAEDSQNWLLAVHYLSICVGANVGNEDPIPIIIQCQPKTGGFKFRTDDPFIVNFMAKGSEYPVLDDTPLDTFDTAPAFVTLILGLVFSVSSIVLLVSNRFGWFQRSLVAQIATCLLAFASTFLMLSSALITIVITRSHGSWMYFQIGGWTQAFLCLTWMATGFIFVAFVWKLVNVVAKKEKRRRLLMTGQI